jgi:hypothetical protein
MGTADTRDGRRSCRPCVVSDGMADLPCCAMEVGHHQRIFPPQIIQVLLTVSPVSRMMGESKQQTVVFQLWL